jgi:hypothetical protein
MWESRDDFLFIHNEPRLSGQLTARVLSLTPTDAWTKAGIMVRESTATDARHAMMVVTPGQGSALQHRASTGGGTLHIPGPAVTAPQWLRLRWSPGEVIASVSSDGKTWRETGRAALDFSGPLLPGLCLSGHHVGALADATFDKISLE